MAHKKGQGSSRNGRDSNPSYLGLKVADGQTVHAGTIILKQRGTKFHPGPNVKRGNDDTLFAISDNKIDMDKAVQSVALEGLNDVVPRFHTIGLDSKFAKNYFYDYEFGKKNHS